MGTRSWSRYVQCTNVRLLPYNTAHNFGKWLRNSLPNSCVRTTWNTRNVNPNPNGKLFESDYWHASCPLYCKLADAHLYISRPWSSGDHSLIWDHYIEDVSDMYPAIDQRKPNLLANNYILFSLGYLISNFPSKKETF